MAAQSFEKYGRVWPAKAGMLDVELIAFRDNFTIQSGGLGKLEHFLNICRVLWPKSSRKPLSLNPWFCDMSEACCTENYVGLAGCGSSGKTDFMATWGIVNYLCSPHNTKVLATSTTLKDARKRIWGSIIEYWGAVPGLPGKLVDSAGIIRYDDGTGRNGYSDKVGLELIPCEKAQEREAIGRLIGFKAHRLFLLADELSELTEALLTAAYSNMALASGVFHMTAASNTSSYFDSFGKYCVPIDGWSAVNEDTGRWRTSRGVVLHFDGLKSPNFNGSGVKYPIYGEKQLAEHKKLGENSLGWWRMCRGWFCPAGSEQGIYSEADLVKFRASDKAVWLGKKTRVAALDPAFTVSGDRTILYFGWVGIADNGKFTVEFDKYIHLREDITKRDVPINFQFAQQFRDKCVEEGVVPQNAALDATGGGGPFADIVSQVWSPLVYRVQFGGKASDTPVSEFDKSPGSSKYVNRVSEIWARGQGLLQSGQIKGVCDELAQELTSRKYTVEKNGGDLRIRVETKSDLKKRIQKSPDLADSAMVLLCLAIERLHASPSLRRKGSRADKWQQFLRKIDVLADTARLHDD